MGRMSSAAVPRHGRSTESRRTPFRMAHARATVAVGRGTGRGGCTSGALARFTSTDSLPDPDSVLVDDQLRERVAKIPSLISADIARLIVLRGPGGSNSNDVVGSIAKALSQNLVTVDGAALAEQHDARFLGTFCAMTRSVPLIGYELAPGDTAELPPLTGYQGPVGVFLGMEGGLSSQGHRKAVTLSLPSPEERLRMAFWEEALHGREGGRPARHRGALPPAGRLHSPGGRHRGRARRPGRARSAVFRRCARGVPYAQPTAAGHACRSARRERQLVATRGERVDDSESCASSSAAAVFASGCSITWVPAFGGSANRGVRALLTGASGTGKTLAAKILAAELGMDLYRVDLAAIINKYIGETEKNLHRVLSRAEALDVVLLLDEGDALLGNRTEVKSANDRYANLETNYLLQRLEHYQGVVLITTNLVENVDRAFQRRMDVVVPFLAPQAQERLGILELHLPYDHELSQDFVELVALRCPLTGGQIRSATMHATLLALDDGKPLANYHLDAALRSEYRKAGGTFPLERLDAPRSPDGGMSDFVAALGARQALDADG